ncbi:MAG: helix-turn-helix domain-containing protein [Nitrosomonas sp.]|nr:helix-turn-helix domain-containing protein [Nitrosomonas sp.]
MEIKEFIEIGERKAGTQKELAKYLNIAASTLRIVKSGRTSLDPAYCIKLARFINKDEIEVIAASRLVTEKDEEKRKIFESCFKRTSQAACIGLVVGLSMILTPSTAQAESLNVAESNTIYIMLYYGRKL